MAPVTVAWLDIGSRTGVCPRCIPGGVARNALACDLLPVDAAEAAGKACVECNEPLAGNAYDGSRVLQQEWVVA